MYIYILIILEEVALDPPLSGPGPLLLRPEEAEVAWHERRAEALLLYIYIYIYICNTTTNLIMRLLLVIIYILSLSLYLS